MNNNVIGPSNMNDGNESFNTEVNNNVEPNKKKNGFNVVLLVLLFIVLLGVTGFGGWKLGTMYSDLENKKTEEKENDKNDVDNKNDDKDEDKENVIENEDDKVKVPSKNEKYTFHSEVTEDIVVNGEKFEILSFYYIDDAVLTLANESGEPKVTRSVLRRDVYVGSKKILDASIVDVFDNKDTAIKHIESLKIDKDDYGYFKDAMVSKNYLVLYLGNNNSIIYGNELITNYSPYFVTAYVVDSTGYIYREIFYDSDNYSLVGIFTSKNDIGDRKSVLVSDVLDNYDVEATGEYFIYHGSVIDYHDDYIYFVEGDCLNYKEYKITIKDGEYIEDYVKDYSEEQTMGAGGC